MQSFRGKRMIACVFGDADALVLRFSKYYVHTKKSLIKQRATVIEYVIKLKSSPSLDYTRLQKRRIFNPRDDLVARIFEPWRVLKRNSNAFMSFFYLKRPTPIIITINRVICVCQTNSHQVTPLIIVMELTEIVKSKFFLNEKEWEKLRSRWNGNCVCIILKTGHLDKKSLCCCEYCIGMADMLLNSIFSILTKM